MGVALVWFEAHHWLCWFWAHLNGVLVQVSVDMCNQPWATCLELPCYSLIVAVSTGLGCTWEGPGCVGEGLSCAQGSASYSSELGADQLKVHSSLRSVSTCQVFHHPVRLPGFPLEPFEEILRSGPQLATPHIPFHMVQTW